MCRRVAQAYAPSVQTISLPKGTDEMLKVLAALGALLLGP